MPQHIYQVMEQTYLIFMGIHKIKSQKKHSS